MDIGGQVNKYCSESLTEMSLIYDDDWNVLWLKPFKKLTKLYLQTLSLDSKNFTASHIPIHGLCFFFEVF